MSMSIKTTKTNPIIIIVYYTHYSAHQQLQKNISTKQQLNLKEKII